MTKARWLALAVLASAAVFAWQGGFFSMSAFRALERQEAASRADSVRLERTVDSLAKFADSLEHDPRVQERVARENFGMVRPGELIVTIVPQAPPKRDSTKP